MARNGSGTYSLPAGNPVISGDVVSSDWANDTLDDVASELTGSLSRNGQGGMLADLTLGGFDVTDIGSLEATDLTLVARPYLGGTALQGMGSGDVIVRIKDNDTTVSASTVFVADTELVATLQVQSLYSVDAYFSIAPSTTGGFKIAFVNDFSFDVARLNYDDYGLHAAVEQNFSATYTTVGDASGVRFAVRVSGFILTDSTDGDVVINWAQQNANGNSVLKRGSWIRFIRQVV